MTVASESLLDNDKLRVGATNAPSLDIDKLRLCPELAPSGTVASPFPVVVVHRPGAVSTRLRATRVNALGPTASTSDFLQSTTVEETSILHDAIARLQDKATKLSADNARLRAENIRLQELVALLTADEEQEN